MPGAPNTSATPPGLGPAPATAQSGSPSTEEWENGRMGERNHNLLGNRKSDLVERCRHSPEMFILLSFTFSRVDLLLWEISYFC